MEAAFPARETVRKREMGVGFTVSYDSNSMW
jgi:hypothetical protein